MRTFVTVAENRHFGTAAAKLGISQPSLSQALVALETGLGIKLIERSTRKVIVTPAGAALLPYAQATLEAAETFVARSRGAHGVLNGPLVIGMIPTVAPYLLPSLLRLCREHFPELEPRIVEETTPVLLDQLRDGLIDLAVVATASERSGLTSRMLYDENFVVALPSHHALAGRDDLSLEELRELDLLLLDDGHCLRDQVIELCHLAQVSTNEITESVSRVSSLTTIVQLVAAGFGATLLPEDAVAAEGVRPGVAIARFAPTVSAERQVRLTYRASSTRVEEFETFGTLITQAHEDTLAAAGTINAGATA
nr:hydrogen peroxide-inducible genes activator [Corynebacterium aquatimens]